MLNKCFDAVCNTLIDECQYLLLFVTFYNYFAGCLLVTHGYHGGQCVIIVCQQYTSSSSCELVVKVMAAHDASLIPKFYIVTVTRTSL